MKRVQGLRARLVIAFAAAVVAAMFVFAAVVVGVVVFNEASEPAVANENPEEGTESVERVLVAMGLASPMVLAGAVALGLWLARTALKPMRDASQRARAARASELDLSLPVMGSDDEWDELAKTMNALLADARLSMVRIRQFTADAAHELKTPLTAIIGMAEVAGRRERSAAEYREALNEVREESVKLARLVDALLMLSQADAGTLLSTTHRVDLAQLAQESVRRIERLNKEAPKVRLHLPATSPIVNGDPVLLARVFDNLLENAFRHGLPPVDLTVQERGALLSVEVSDHGRGVPALFAARMFERFSRADSAREGDGQGLGLAIARAIVMAHRGSLDFVQDEAAISFRLSLPAGAPEAILKES